MRESERERERGGERKKEREFSTYNIHLIRSRPRNFSIREGSRRRKKFERRKRQNVEEDNFSFFRHIGFEPTPHARQSCFVSFVSLFLSFCLSLRSLSLTSAPLPSFVRSDLLDLVSSAALVWSGAVGRRRRRRRRRRVAQYR